MKPEILQQLARLGRPTGSSAVRRTVFRGVVILLLCALGTAVRAAEPDKIVKPDNLAKARTLYNEGRYEAAMEAAIAARDEPSNRQAALLILGRAGLERYRYTADQADLTAARDALRGIDGSALSPRDRSDMLIGVGEALYFDEAYRPAADLFESMLEGTEIKAGARDQVLDWWATSIDRYVRALPGPERAAAYDHLMATMERELRRDSGSSAAAYWLAAGAFARGQVERAWSAAVSGWVRALITPDRGAALRPDLDRLVREAIIPERVRRLPVAGTPEGEQAAAGMLAEWEHIKEKWSIR
jgi:tetratricopeptide (TPR) repeat protein